MTLKTKEARSMSQEDLKNKLEELKKELVKQNAQIATGTTPKSPGLIKETKKTIARILTVIQEMSKKLSNVPEGYKKSETFFRKNEKLPKEGLGKPKVSQKGLGKSKTSQKEAKEEKKKNG